MRTFPIASITACFSLFLAAGVQPATAAQPTYGPQLEGFDYPHPVQRFAFESQGQPLSMAYLDVAPKDPNGRTVVLLHGKNFCAATWESAITALNEAGYRVIAPDQIGFCKSSKPQRYQFSFGQLAANTHTLLTQLGIYKATIVGHSMGGMLGTRYALQYPQATERLALVNPIGLEDWKAEGVPWRSVDQWYERELKTSFDSIKQYQLNVYYSGQWRPDYERWVAMLAGMYAGDGKQAVAWNQALTSDMVFNQPVFYEFPKLAVPTTLFIGQKDRTAIGKDLAPPELAKRLGNYPALGKRAAATIPGATLIEFAELGHSPQVEDPQRFNAALLEALE
ncbi:alpha/beta fold hydrolase [Pseudoxanthomonas wuyuanensis]|uniref:Pimeloyl-ACP methyl ester carboxylesterase n=1 Tax=Pseudoxanthomonas wuyuanensis TaxID=1073196 RepID=A0A286DCK1_9GAMM|nr:alpha/beta hydrolase [Pseudoxanthomonas wuyuanensis]KAF1719302.1 alpha/beta hydrolase [Pseudoxanthomonas wuyuanensis]SOD56371.1 Pimeloyl-ACP methyl ester carboxylesterase [Pseudoxanthomonas wuyuanensis]